MGRKGSPADQFAPTYGVWAVLDGVEAHQFCQLCADRAPHEVIPAATYEASSLFNC